MITPPPLDDGSSADTIAKKAVKESLQSLVLDEDFDRPLIVMTLISRNSIYDMVLELIGYKYIEL
jgi:hypothetical protein